LTIFRVYKELFRSSILQIIKEDDMKKFFRLAALLIGICASGTLQAQTFTVHKYSIGGEGGTDYLTAEPGTGRIFVSRSSHVMVIDGNTGKVVGDIPETPNTHGIALVAKYNHGFTTNRGDSTLSMFDLTTLATIKKIKIPAGGQDGIMYDDFTDRIILTNHSNPGTATAVDPNTGVITGEAQLDDNSPEGAASDGKGKLFVNLERKNSIQIVDAKTMKALGTWALDSCDGPTGIAYDRTTSRIFSGCSKMSAVVNPVTGKIVATILNGEGVDALGWDPSEKLIYIPAGRDSSVTIVHEDSPDHYTVVATVTTMTGAKTISVDTVKHVAYLFQPQYGPAPADAPLDRNGRRPRGPVIGAYLIVINH
jgi:DNA-binding beta-propeller fold protein YncE